VGWGVTEYFGVRGIDLTVFSAGASSFGVPSILYPMNQTFTYVELAIMMVITSVIAGLYPGMKAIRVKPVEAIRTIG
ncbi:MAG: ABC transporter permease, partial [Bacteroidota bacterium]